MYLKQKQHTIIYFLYMNNVYILQSLSYHNIVTIFCVYDAWWNIVLETGPNKGRSPDLALSQTTPHPPDMLHVWDIPMTQTVAGLANQKGVKDTQPY